MPDFIILDNNTCSNCKYMKLFWYLGYRCSFDKNESNRLTELSHIYENRFFTKEEKEELDKSVIPNQYRTTCKNHERLND